MSFQSPDPARFERAISAIDAENARDPNMMNAGGETIPRELLYARWLSQWVERLAPEASEHLRLAARSQHICRWLIPRDTYPMDRPGYLRWRSDLKRFHAEKTGEIMRQAGYAEPEVARVQNLNLKKDLPSDPETQTLEDALCLVFLEHQLVDLVAKTAEEKVISALQKSWKKMSPQAREVALGLEYGDAIKVLLHKALSGK